jgi:Icc protein
MPHLLHLSDIHFTASGGAVDGRDPDARLETVLDAVARQFARPDLVIVSGDLTDDASEAGCRRLATRLDRLGVPVLAVPGNHDRSEFVRAAFGRPVAEVAGWRIVGIDTSRPNQVHGTVDVGAATAELDAGPAQPTIVVLHHPPVSPSTHEWFQLDQADEFASELAARPHVRAILTGHLHQPFEASARGVPVLGGPSTLVALRHAGREFEIGGSNATGARQVTLAADGTLTTMVLPA